ncbi:uncharacterized protein LOC107803993 [Nicotiana tabacum]|uniref:Annexin A13-like n=2 Tax=Nicotiana TaxID=4085 RepID=A0A1S4B353_TOBAC|nr:PREDICTED: annexin A13-like [Nicotiana sylvestris]XP_016483284.1 PREDICTED: annexin A13-like [Nicotiana tabacum]
MSLSSEMCETICQEIHSCCELKTHLIHVLAALNTNQRYKIKEKYMELYGEDPFLRFQNSIHRNDPLISSSTNRNSNTSSMAALGLAMLLKNPHQRDADVAREALEENEVNYRALMEIFTCRKSSHVALIRQAYLTKFRRHLDNDISSIEPPHPCQKILMALSASHKAHNADVSQHIAKCDARRLYQTGEGRTGVTVDEAVVLEILSKRSIPQLKLTFSSYKHIYGHSYAKYLKFGKCGELEEAVEAVVKYICSPAKYFSQMLYECLKGTTRDKGGLMRIMVSRAEVDMEDIEVAFNKKYGVHLENAICQSIPQGDYREFLVTLAANRSTPTSL